MNSLKKYKLVKLDGIHELCPQSKCIKQQFIRIKRVYTGHIRSKFTSDLSPYSLSQFVNQIPIDLRIGLPSTFIATLQTIYDVHRQHSHGHHCEDTSQFHSWELSRKFVQSTCSKLIVGFQMSDNFLLIGCCLYSGLISIEIDYRE